MLPAGSAAIALIKSPLPPKNVEKSSAPFGPSLSTNDLGGPWLAGEGLDESGFASGKSADCVKPTTYALPEVSTAIPPGVSKEAPPMHPEQIIEAPSGLARPT